MSIINPKGAGRKAKIATNKSDEYIMLIIQGVRSGKYPIEVLDDGAIDISASKNNCVTLKRVAHQSETGRNMLIKSLQVETDESVYNFTGKYVRRLERACSDILFGKKTSTKSNMTNDDLEDLLSCI